MKLKLQQFGGRGSGSGGGGLLGKQGDVGRVTDVRDMISERSKRPTETDDVLQVARRLTGLYGESGIINQFQIARVSGGTLAYYDMSGNIAMNERFMNSAAMTAAYDAAVKSGFHPSRGNQSGITAVASHEYGHALTDAAAKKLGANDIESGARKIVEQARKKTSHTTNMSFAGKISGYAQYNFAECVAEAVSDWYCNGSKAKKESRAVMAVINSALRK